MLISNNLFKVIVYIVGIYFLFIEHIIIKAIGIIIIIAHLYKDIYNFKKWPLICEYIGIIIALLLIYIGFIINNNIVFLIGLYKCYAHIRQLLYNDDKYYY